MTPSAWHSAAELLAALPGAAASSPALARLLVGIDAFLAALVLIALSNWRPWRRLTRGDVAGLTGDRGEKGRGGPPRVSILVPARDEARHIGPCVRSLLAQDYGAFEVIALDDGSTDGTGAILGALAQGDPRLRVLGGAAPPAGWTGKNWACHQLARAAGGELLLFTDADTRHDPRALGDAVAVLQAMDADLVSVLPRQELRTWGERLIVPILPWSLFSVYPAVLAARLPWPPLAMAVGQVMLFRAEAYRRIGGHAAVRTHVAEDVAFAKRLAAAGRRVRLVNGAGRVTCRMYDGFGPAWEGLGRSLYDALGRRPVVFAAIWAWLGVAFLAPIAVVAAWLPDAAAAPPPTAALAAVALALVSWGLTARRFDLPILLVPAYPAIMAAALAVAAHSLILGLRGGATWKGRPVAAARP